MTNRRKWYLIAERAVRTEGGSYSGPRIGGLFRVWYVTGGDGFKIRLGSYTLGGWKVQKKRITYDDKPVEYAVKNAEDIASRNTFVEVKYYAVYAEY